MQRESSTGVGAPTLRLDLANYRIGRGITLQEIAASTKISPRFLRAIEAERFDLLPGGLLTRSYIRQYAQAIGYDADHILALLDEEERKPATACRPVRNEQGRRSFWKHWTQWLEAMWSAWRGLLDSGQ